MLNGRELPAKPLFFAPPGDRLQLETPDGDGWGVGERMMLEEYKKQLEELQKEREEDVKRVAKVANFELFKNISASRERFIYELLQNAEDTEAKSISFHVENDQIRVVHDGKAFSWEDVLAITKYGYSTKRGRAALIGEYGIGFKSVFNVTDRPCIRSGNYHFHLKDLIVPIPVEAQDGTPCKETEFTLPFKRNVDDEVISEYIDSFIGESLLFLTHIKEIHFPFFSFHKEEQLLPNKKLKVCRVSLRKDENEIGAYLLFENPSQKVQIAYKLDDEGQIEEPDADLKKIFVFFSDHRTFILEFLDSSTV